MENKAVLGIDLETYSDIDIQACGSFRYVDSPAFEVLLFGYAWNGEPAKVVDLTAGEQIPADVLEGLYSPDVVKTGWNNAFERYALWKHLGQYCPPEQWQDTMVLAAQCGLPLKLELACEALQMGEDKAKMKDGKALIQYFCKPCEPTKSNGGRTRNMPWDAPDKWETFKRYNARDVDSEGDIRKMLIRFAPSDIEHRFWCLDAHINEKGVRYDPELARAAIKMDKEYKDKLIAEATDLTGLENPKSVAQVKAWLSEQEGIEVKSLNKKNVPDVVAKLKTDEAKRFMELRAGIAKSSVSKYDAMLRSANPEDEHIRGCFQFYGANRTGRFAGRLVQLQNLPQNHLPDLALARELVRAGDAETVELLFGSISSTLSELIRTALIPEPGQRFIVRDFSAIEARVTAWFADEKWRLDTFRAGGDIYCASASQMFKVPVEKHGVNSHLRQKGKVAELALGYGGGPNALIAFGADKMGMTSEEMQETVTMWREASPNICAFWRAMENAAIKAILRRSATVSRIGGVVFEYTNGILWMTLPSGRRIAYWGAQYGPSKWNRNKNALSYMGVDQKTKKWSRVETWGGKLVENCVQATSRDVLRDKMLALCAAGFDIRAHVHDEVIITEPIDGKTLEDVGKIMNEALPWAPGLPLNSDGYYCDFYKKD
ncbi:MAG: DNA polymerase [Prevotella sp.]